jgi:hypothetical protein
MADVNKSIEISYRADLKQLLNELKKMPGMTEEEAKKMVTQLDRQLKQAEKAAQRTGKNTARGMKEVDRATKVATNSMRQFRQAGRNADRIFGELSTGLELISPELGAMAGFASQASSGIEALGRAIGGMNPYLIAITIAAAAAGLAYQYFTVDAKAVEEQAKKTAEKLQELNQATVGIESGANNARLELAVLKGEISAVDAQILQDEYDIRKEQEAGILAARERTQVYQDALKLLDIRIQKNASLSEQETIQLHALEKSIDVLNEIGNLDEGGVTGKARRAKAAELLTDKIREEYAEEQRIKGIVEEQVELNEKLILEKERQRQASEAQKQAEKDAAAAAKERQKREAAARAEAQRQLAQQKAMMSEVERIQEGINKQFMNEGEAIAHNYDTQIERLREIKAELGDQIDIETELADLKLLKEKELYEFRQEQDQKIAEARKKTDKEEKARRQEMLALNMDFASSMIGSYSSITNAVGKLYGDLAEEDAELALKLHKMNQSAEIANIAMITARGIAEASARFAGRPVRKALAIGGVVTAGAMQSAAVAATPPPTFDMGGMIGNFDMPRPGDTLVRATAGEAILDTSTVERIGGAEGVRALQNGGMMAPQVIVMNPFKHLDKYNKSALRRTSAMNTEAYKSRRFGAMGY